ncbi:Six-hairpin glycosidase-like protein [Phaeosphaeria sp. MPI-PUGE-AT-0046c]|nr:Six-hairpin glycosidase-like protein [Phaeosphaeria sp. MPI-PUGE-AT-0046c]
MGGIAIEPEIPRDPRGSDGKRDFSAPWLFNLKIRKSDKTIDIGGHGLSLSLDALGRVWTRMLQSIKHDRPGFGLDFGINNHLVSIRIVETNVALYNLTLADNVDLMIRVKVTRDGGFEQFAEATNKSAGSIRFPYALNINSSINRASYGQLNEGGPVPLPASRNILGIISPTTLCVFNLYLKGQCVTRLDINGQPLQLHGLQEQEVIDATLCASVKGQVFIPPGESATFCANFRLLPDTERYDHILPYPQLITKDIRKNLKARWIDESLLTTYILRRNVEYILGNCVLPVSDSIAVVVTDHVALPLVRLLLETYANAQSLLQPPFVEDTKREIKTTVQGHLNWVFTRAKRPHGFWHRSYLANGEPKDPSIFQLDQQCYPLLELCDFLDSVVDILAVLATKQDPDTQLWSTDETPGDDAVIYPHHFSSHVLLWRTFTRLYQLHLLLGQASDNQAQWLFKLAAQVKERAMQAFIARHPSHGLLFSYLTNGHGESTFYHDANDIPTAFAKEWAFVSSPDEISIWKSTMSFGISSANKNGYCNEVPYGGLGSVHSPGAWTLGYFQELSYAAFANDVDVMQSTWTKIAAAMQWDGTFSEAVDAKTAECTSKAWFSWPGAMIGALLIRLKLNGQEEVLLQ